LQTVRFDAVYAPGGDESLVGGDWYDAFELPDGRIMVTIGDVTGRGLLAAVLMSKVRQSLSALSYYETDPVKLLDVVQSAVQRRHPDAIVTAFVGILDCKDLTFTYATAGHPMPYLRRGDAVVPLPAHGLPIGLRTGKDTSAVVAHLAHDDVVLLYTDGLTESTHDIVEGEARVTAALRSADSGNVAHYIEHLVLPQGSPDDVALLAMRISDGHGEAAARTLGLQFDARDVRMARESRLCITTFLRELGAPQEELLNAELVYGELISNVVRHAPGNVSVSVDWTGEYPELRMTDEGDGYSKRSHLPRDLLSESGRGLFIVESLTRQFDVGRAPHGGSDVRALLNVRRATAEAASGS
jgi:anti-sigma regulatory factor (Ser/Thr protein kinase)